MDDLLTRYVLPEWHEADETRWKRIDDASDDEVWRVREQGRERLVAFLRQRLRDSALARGVSESDVAWTGEVLDPEALTIGFARRFATYKRATLLLSQPERLKALLLSGDRPVQFVFAGKAHPADDTGKEMIRQIVQFSRDPEIRHRIAFIEDYDMVVARHMYQGCDVWLNTPAGPGGLRHQRHEGGPQRRAQLLDPRRLVGRDVRRRERLGHHLGRDLRGPRAPRRGRGRQPLRPARAPDRAAVLRALRGPVPRRWVRRVKASLRSLGPRVSASRMVRDYVEQMYEPAAPKADPPRRKAAGGAQPPFAPRKARPGRGWRCCSFSVDTESTLVDLGSSKKVEAVVALGLLDQRDVEVQLLHGPVGANEELQPSAAVVTMDLVGLDKPGPGDGGEPRTSTATPAPSPASGPGATASRCGSCRRTPTCGPSPSSGCVAWAGGCDPRRP